MVSSYITWVQAISLIDNIMYCFIFPMKPGKEDWQGVHPRVDELFALHDLVEETENELCDM